MRVLNRVLQSEWLKIRKSNLWLLIFVSPVLAFFGGLVDSEIADWGHMLSQMLFIHALLFLPLLTGVFSAFVCRYEHGNGGWKQLLALPMTRTHLYVAKFMIVILLLVFTQLNFFVGVFAAGQIQGVEQAFPWEMMLRSGIGGILAVLPLIALQLTVSIAWSSFAAPLALNFVFTIPNILIVNSEKYGPWYPWAQPLLAMMPHNSNNFGAFNISFETLIYVILGSFVVFFVSGFTYFQRKEV
jgi:lantibiotic transport system permease protein